MDSTEPPYSQARFEEIQKEVQASSRRLATTQLLFPSSPSPDGMETTCWRPPRICPGTRVGRSSVRRVTPLEPPSWTPLTPSSHPPGLPTSPSGCPFRMSTKLEALEQYPWAVSRPVSSSLVLLSPSPLLV